MENYQITEWCHHFIKEQVREGDFCIDATCGNGYDTVLLCDLVGEKGLVAGFDIQEQAIKKTRNRLNEKGFEKRVRLFCCGHETMESVLAEDPVCEKMIRCTDKNYGRVSCVVFNFGYLPGGSHELATKADTSVKAIEQSLKLLKKGGIISLCIYSGQDSGFEEKNVLLDYLKELDSREYLVIMSSYYNRPNHPPIPGLIIRV